jgi:hypothetical protein
MRREKLHIGKPIPLRREGKQRGRWLLLPTR